MSEKRRTKKKEKKEQKQEKRRMKYAEKWEKQRLKLVPINKKGLHKIRLMSFLKVLFVPLHCFIYPYKLHGHTKVAPGPCIYVGNHFAMWDPIYPVRTTKEGIRFIAKESILEAPAVGYLTRKLGVIGAKRDGSDVRTVIESMKLLKNGEKLCIFPEGTRNRGSEEQFLPFKSGFALLAVRAQVPVIPFVVCSRPHIFRRVHVIFGEPMAFEEFYGKKLTAEESEAIEARVIAKMHEMRNQFVSARTAKKKRPD